jgi:hypothetical protein
MTGEIQKEDYKRAILSWHKKASFKFDYFIKFISEYLAFIAFINTQLYLGLDNDRLKIQRLKRNNKIKNLYLNSIVGNRIVLSSWDKVIEELNRFPLGNVSQDATSIQEIKWWNFSGKNLNSKRNQEERNLTGRIYSTRDWENMVEFWYSIRNNLFHGTKDPELERDRLLVSNGFKTLKPLVQIFISNMENISNIQENEEDY